MPAVDGGAPVAGPEGFIVLSVYCVCCASSGVLAEASVIGAPMPQLQAALNQFWVADAGQIPPGSCLSGSLRRTCSIRSPRAPCRCSQQVTYLARHLSSTSFPSPSHFPDPPPVFSGILLNKSFALESLL